MAFAQSSAKQKGLSLHILGGTCMSHSPPGTCVQVTPQPGKYTASSALFLRIFQILLLKAASQVNANLIMTTGLILSC